MTPLQAPDVELHPNAFSSEKHGPQTEAVPAIYTQGGYLEQNPTWHIEDSPWKARQILKMIRRHQLHPQTVCEVGCGAGEILVQLSGELAADCQFWGYDISPQAHALAAERENERLHFQLGDLTDDTTCHFDLALTIDLLEHLEDYYGFLRKLKPRADSKIFHFPLDLSAYSVFRSHPILDMRRSVGHIHYFSCDTALAALRDTGYEILDWFYPVDDESSRGKRWRQRLLSLVRESLFKIAPHATVRLLGGRSLLVLAR